MRNKQKNDREVNGVLVLDKPLGISSNGALQIIKRLYRARKAGHSGSLDPLASGILPILLGEATKFSQFLLDADKKYLVTAKLGFKTTTGDAEGEIIETREIPIISDEFLKKIVQQFTGIISQIPPMHSALKHQGQPLYKLARQGIAVERAARNITIYELSVIERDEQSITFHVHCTKGTYVRTLVEDIGEALGCGAHVSVLRRISAGPYTEDYMHNIESLEALSAELLDTKLLPIDTAVQHWPAITLSASETNRVLKGQSIPIQSPSILGNVRLMSNTSHFLGVGEVLEDGKLTPQRLIHSTN